MLRIRWEQLAVFRNYALKSFEDRMRGHLSKCFPQQCKNRSDTDLRTLIQYGIKSAAKYGITAERDVCKYIDVMIVSGRDFDRDPQLPWASSILNDEALKVPATKIKRLHKAAKAEVRGGGVEHVER
jgi:hypothetical protein